MRYMPIIKVKAGMILGQDIYDGEGKVLFEKEIMLDRRMHKDCFILGFREFI